MEIPFVIRPFTLADCESLVKHGNNKRIANNMTNRFPHPYTLAHAETFITFANETNPIRIFAIEVNNEACGSIGIHPQEDILCKNAEIGYWISETYWEQGIMTRAVKQILPFAFDQFDINRLFGRAFGYNIASQKVLEKSGFKFETRFSKTIYKNGIYTDELFYAIRRDEFNEMTD